MYIVYGINKKTNPVSFIGLYKCRNCQNITNFYLYEYSVKPTVFFIPIIKIKSQFYVACSVCSHGVEISKNHINKFINLKYSLPDQRIAIKLFDVIYDYFLTEDSRLKEYILTTDINMYNWDKIADIIKDDNDLNGINRVDILYIYSKVVKAVTKSDSLFF